MKKRNFALLISIFVIFLAFNGCGRSKTAVNKGKDHLTVILNTPLLTLDPAMADDQSSFIVIKQIYDTLVNLDENMEPVPNLAEKWAFENDSDGQPVYLRLFLKQNVKFHNGEVFKAQDVKFSLEKAAESPQTGSVLNMIRSVETVNDNEAIIVMAYPFAPILNHLSYIAASIANSKDPAFSTESAGTGPMKLDGWMDDRIELIRWDEYHGEAPHLKNITIRITADREEGLTELENSAADLLIDVLPEEVSRIENNPDLQLFRAANFLTNYVGVNCRKPPFNDVRVRQALAYAIDPDVLNENLYIGSGGISAGPDKLKRFDYNPERSRQLLAEAGYPNGFSAGITVNDTPRRIETAEIIRDMLAQIGVKLEIKLAEWNAFLDMTAGGSHDMYILGWVTVTGDPDYGLYSVFHSESSGAPGNRSFYSNAEVDRLLDSARKETDPVKRKQLYEKAQEIIRNEAAWVFQWQGEDINAAAKNLRGFKSHPSGYYELWPILFEQ